jgi:hypothetical protein
MGSNPKEDRMFEINLKDRFAVGLDGKPTGQTTIKDGKLEVEKELLGEIAGNAIAQSQDGDYLFCTDLGRKLYKCEAKTQLTPKEKQKAEELIKGSRLPVLYKSQIMDALENAKSLPKKKETLK